MTDTAEITAKKADGQAIVDVLDGLAAQLEALKAEPRWFTGLSPVLETTLNMATHHARAIQQTFGLPPA